MPPLHPSSPPSASASSAEKPQGHSSSSSLEAQTQAQAAENLPRPSAAYGGKPAVTLGQRLAQREKSAPQILTPNPDPEPSKVPEPAVDEFGLPIRTRPISNSNRYSLQKEDDAHHEDASLIPLTEAKSQVIAEDKRQDATAISSSDFQPQPQLQPSTSSDNPSNTQKDGSDTVTKTSKPKVSEWSYQHMNASDGEDDEEDEEDDGGWKDMPALGELDYYDDCGHLVAKAGGEEEADDAVYQGLGGAGKGYTRVFVDDDAHSTTSLDEDTGYLFKEPQSNTLGLDDDDDPRDPLSQLQTTKELLTEGQRIAYVGVTRLMIFQIIKEVRSVQYTRPTKKYYSEAVDALTKWGQKIMMRLYMHMDISSDEQIMIEQLSQHGVMPEDLVPPLMQNAKVKNPISTRSNRASISGSSTTMLPDQASGRSRSLTSGTTISASPSDHKSSSLNETTVNDKAADDDNDDDDDQVPEVHGPSDIPTSADIDVDLRWTVLCDLFLVLISDSVYDSRSRRLLERVGETMNVSWRKICRFEKRVVDALEMQQQDPKEHWDESDNMERRRKLALKKRYLVMGLATVGGGLIIGLSAGLLAPVIGAGLAAGFTTVGITGTGAFLGGVGGTTLITSGATLAGGTIAIRASDRRTGAVKTFEYRPLHNNKRLNLIITVSGWMTGKVDDVRLPFSTVDPIMGDIYSVLWEPEMLQSIGDTINILATEALTQGLQQVLGSTVLVALMASLQLPLLLTKLAYLIDNPWSVSLDRATAAGLIMADSLIDRNLGNRPVTLVGFSLGSRMIFSCLKELARKKALGLVQNVYLFGSPMVANKDEYLIARTAVAGRFVNGYASNDWILGYLFRATSGGIMRVAGLAPVEIPGIENVNVTEFVTGHMAYRAAMPRIMRSLGWEVESDEFAEIEEPDPENHAERQRELIRELDEARRAAREGSGKKRFGIFKRAKKKEWENYIVQRKDSCDSPLSPRSSIADEAARPRTVLFDIEAIRAELASEQMDVKELESTLPPIKVDLNTPTDAQPKKDDGTITEISKPMGSEGSNQANARTTQAQKQDQRITYAYDEAADADPAFTHQEHSSTWPSRTESVPFPSDEKSPWDSLHPHTEEEGIEMTFGTSFDEPNTWESHLGNFPQKNSAIFDHTPFDAHKAPSESPVRSPVPVDFHSPSAGAALAVDHLPSSRNVWADDEFGHGEADDGVHMTFE
ncbi:hypothetical protein KEM56_003748 [Ascosphaera pollenicola]|nr:hypothetical protein KEM56_003748 [Ascosphaera pollenicola]